MQYYMRARFIFPYSKVKRILYLIRGKPEKAKDKYKNGLSTDDTAIAALSCVVLEKHVYFFGIKLLVCI